ncbi:MAG: Fur family transcriptional regulator [Spirochaetales bacterium]|nr:Fur family transcriptional regulator [Spirochaetales bacterium]
MTDKTEIDIKSLLEEAGIKPTLQRLKIYEYLITNKNHPTVDKLYSDLHDLIPTLSKTTLYNTLNLFVEKKITVPITIEMDEGRYDADVSSHGHFKCRKCGAVYDFPHIKGTEDGELPSGFVAERTHLYVWGLCENCQKNIEK